MSYQHEAGLREQIGDLQRQLAEAKALLSVRVQESNEWEALARDRQEEIEEMRPFLKMANRHRSLVSSACACDVCLVLCEYEARKQP